MALVVAYHLDRSRALAAGATIDAPTTPAMPADVPDLESEWPVVSTMPPALEPGQPEKQQ